MKATVGGIVHYGVDGSEPRAAMITEVHGGEHDEVSLVVFAGSGFSFVQRVRHSDQRTSGHWSWPPRLDEKHPVAPSSHEAPAAPLPVTAAPKEAPAAAPSSTSAPAAHETASAGETPASAPAAAAAPAPRTDGWRQDAHGRWHPPGSSLE